MVSFAIPVFEILWKLIFDGAIFCEDSFNVLIGDDTCFSLFYFFWDFAPICCLWWNDDGLKFRGNIEKATSHCYRYISSMIIWIWKKHFPLGWWELKFSFKLCTEEEGRKVYHCIITVLLWTLFSLWDSLHESRGIETNTFFVQLELSAIAIRESPIALDSWSAC